jgi:hypothetical protein
VSFDLPACAADLAPAAEVRTIADLAGERGTPPPQLARMPLVTAAVRTRAEAAIAAAWPESWHPHVELDGAGMAELITLDVPGVHGAAELAPEVQAFMRAHACLFGLAAPDHVHVAPYLDRWLTLSVDPVAVVDAEHAHPAEDRTDDAGERCLKPGR